MIRPEMPRRRRAGSRPRLASHRLESLEPRLLMAVFTVNSFDDTFNPPAGTVTLRSAIQAANALIGSDTINLPSAGTYRITTLGSGTSNSAGELAIFPPLVPRIPGNLTIQNTSGGTVTIDGGGLNRVFDVNPGASAVQYNVTFQGLVITRGHSGSGDGGGIDIHGAANVVLNGCVVAGNTSFTGGGGIATEAGSTGALTLNATQVTGNFTTDGGGGIGGFGNGTVTVGPQSRISGNTAFLKGGGGVEVDEAALAVSGAIISGNRTLVSEGIQIVSGGIENDGGGPVSIAGSLIEDNTSAGSGGGYGDAGLNNLTVTDSVFLGNVAAGAGGDIAARGPLVTITTTTLGGNTALAEDAALDPSDSPDGGGGFRFVGPGTVQLTDCTIIGNRALEEGGGIAYLGTGSSKLQVTGCTVADNVSSDGGGLASDRGGDVAISNSLFRDNSAGSDGQGGGLTALNGSVEIAASRFTGNAARLAGAATLGGVISITGSTFDANRSAIQGSAIGVEVTANDSLTNCTIAANTCITAGALGSALSVQGGATGILGLTDDTIDGNAGGGVSQTSGSVSVGGTIVASNPGGDYSYGSGTLTDSGGNLLGSTAGSGNKFGAGTLTGDPKLGPLVDNGGPQAGAPSTSAVVPTQALLPGSPAFTGSFVHFPFTDARGFARPGGLLGTPFKQAIGAYQPQYAANATPNAIYAENTYEVLFNRPADPAGLTGSSAFLGGGSTPTALIQLLQTTTEYLDDQAMLLYRRYLDRAPSAFELSAVAGVMKSGATSEQVAASLVGAGEFFGDFGNNNDVFVEGAFVAVLGRPTNSAGEFAAWDAMLAQGTTRQAVASVLLTTQEYLSDLIVPDFTAYLGRSPSPSDMAAFLASAKAGVSSPTLAAIALGASFGART